MPLLEGSNMDFEASYPSSQHQIAAEVLVAFFRQRVETEAVLLVNSCAWVCYAR